jgi:hypothetical protein
MLNNMEIVGYIKDAKVIENWERLGIKGFSRLWCCYKSGSWLGFK